MLLAMDSNLYLNPTLVLLTLLHVGRKEKEKERKGKKRKEKKRKEKKRKEKKRKENTQYRTFHVSLMLRYVLSTGLDE